MYEGYKPDDEFGDDSVVEPSVPSPRIPFYFNNIRFDLTRANTSVRMFFGEDLSDYSRVIIRLEDGSSAPFQPGSEFMQMLVRKGIPPELPDELDETDQEFMDTRMRIWTEGASDELDELE